MAALPFETRNSFLADLGTARQTQQLGTSLQYSRSGDRTWEKWTRFCAELNVDPQLQEIDDPVRILEVFAVRTRDGRISKSGQPVRASTVDQTLRSVGQAFSQLGSPDPRLDHHGNLDLRLRRLIAGFKRTDPPPRRVKPIPISILHHAVDRIYNDPQASPALHAAADMLIIGFYFLMRPGEHCHTTATDTSHPFLLRDLELFCGNTTLDHASASLVTLQTATFVKLTFTTQKNGVRGERIGHARSGHRHFCPVTAIIKRIWHHRTYGSLPHLPLHCFYNAFGGIPHNTTSATITKLLRDSCAAIGEPLGLNPAEIDARSLRSSGAMSLLCARVDTDWIKLLGRWKSDAMLRYLHVQAAPAMQNFASQMLAGGDYSFRPSRPTPGQQPAGPAG